MKKRRSGYASWRRGVFGEWTASLYLRAKGYRLVSRNVRMRSGEIDIIVEKGGVLIAVEVKNRNNLQDSLESVDWRKRQRIIQGFKEWLGREYEKGRDWTNRDMRYDVLVVGKGFSILHMKSAFFEE